MKRLLLLALPIALAACARPPQEEAPTPPPLSAATAPAPADSQALAAYHWRLADAKDAQGQRIDALFAQAGRPVTLDFSEGRLAISNTCNRMSGGYTVESQKLTIGRLTSTLMACADDKLMALDREVGQRLEGALVLAMQSGATPQLTLTTASGDALIFTGEATAETRYGGPGERAFLEVAAETRPCNHPIIPDKQCLQVRDLSYDDKGIKTTSGEWRNFHDSIEGYTHEPGVRNVLRVKRFAVKNPPADASSTAYVLDMVVESEVVKK